MRIGTSPPSLGAPRPPLANPTVLRAIALSAAAVPLIVCSNHSEQSAQAAALVAPGVLSAAAGGAIGAQTLGRMIKIEGMGELATSLGMAAGAAMGAALCSAATALKHDYTLLGSLGEALSSAATVSFCMAVTTGLLAGNRPVREDTHLPSLLGVLWVGAMVSGLSCLLLRPR